jgi:alpha-N-arabinofuranosidase
LYGQFLQHGGDIVNTGVWSEMLADRKFFYPVAASGPKPPPVMGNAAGNRRFNRTPTRWSAPIACDDFITMDTTTPYSGDQPAVNPGSDTYPLDVSAALSEDRKTLAIAVLNPSDSEQTIKIAIKGAKLASAGKLWRMAPDSIDATVQVDKKPEVQVEEQTLAALPKTITVRPFSVSIYSYPVQ